MRLELKLQISTRAKSPLMELVSIKEDLQVLLDLYRHDIHFINGACANGPDVFCLSLVANFRFVTRYDLI